MPCCHKSYTISMLDDLSNKNVLNCSATTNKLYVKSQACANHEYINEHTYMLLSHSLSFTCFVKISFYIAIFTFTFYYHTFLFYCYC